ncbi:MAG: M15 family metallopeptidase [Actinomycetota bacterium]|nr:M15 family metallopeptidase [Actinomycetota bacterium]
MPPLLAYGLLIGLLAGGCVGRLSGEDATPSLSEAAAPPAPAVSAEAVSPGLPPAVGRPPWLGTRVLPRRSDGFGEVRPTPPELRDRRLPSPDLLPAPQGDGFVAEVRAVPEEVVRRSTWSPRCPVALEDLRYVTLVFWGFDERPHTGELLVNASVAEDVVAVFRRLYEARFPIEEMRVVSAGELVAPPTGDGNNTTSYVCRAITGGASWSEHAYGLAVDINPFHNPYVKGDLVIPELASAYTNRGWRRPGMIFAGDEATRSFGEIGWAWGGDWRRPKDWMHFSRQGR